MYFLSTEERQLLLKSLLPQARQQVVAEDLRGWTWSAPPMAPAYSVRLGVAEVASRYCETGRDLWWKKVQSVKAEPTEAMVDGGILHSVVARIISSAKRLIWTYGIEGISEVIEQLRKFDEDWFKSTAKEASRLRLRPRAEIIWSYECSIMEARLREALSRQPYAKEDSLITSALPVVVEQRMDGSLLGLSKHLSMDAYQSAEPLVLELKFGEKRHFHRVQVAGYALVAESLYEYPLNIGCIVYPSFATDRMSVDKDFFLIDEELRQEFLEQRDERMQMIFEETDPGLMNTCPHDCPYYKHCYA